MIKNLSLQGCGVRCIAEVGAVSILEEKGLLSSIERIAGTSGGAIIGCLTAMKYTPAEMKTMVFSLNFKNFEDGTIFDMAEVFTKYGIHKGDVFLQFIKDKIKAKTGNENSTFADFKRLRYLDLNVFAASLKTKSLKRFSFADTPNVSVAEAVRCSMSIPLFFQAFQINSELFVDGGTCYNYPITAFDKDGANEETAGIGFANLSNIAPDENIDYGHFGKYIISLAETSLASQEVDLMTNIENVKRTCTIDTLGISATNFGLTDDQKNKLFISGQNAMNLYLKK